MRFVYAGCHLATYLVLVHIRAVRTYALGSGMVE